MKEILRGKNFDFTDFFSPFGLELAVVEFKIFDKIPLACSKTIPPNEIHFYDKGELGGKIVNVGVKNKE